MAEPAKVFQFSILHLKPKYLIQYLQELPNAVKMMEKQGAKIHGVWLTEAGASCQIIVLVEWSSFDKHAELAKHCLQDPELIALVKKLGRYIHRGEEYICTAELFSKPFSKTEPIWVERLKPKVASSKVISDILEIAKSSGGDFAQDIYLNAILLPVAFTENCIWSIWQCQKGHSLDRTFCQAAEFIKDTSPELEQFGKDFEYKSIVLARPVDFDNLPK